MSKLYNFDFGEYVPNFNHRFSQTEIKQIINKKKELLLYYDIDVTNIILWLLFWLNNYELKYLCIYFLYRETGYINKKEFEKYYKILYEYINWINYSIDFQFIMNCYCKYFYSPNEGLEEFNYFFRKNILINLIDFFGVLKSELEKEKIITKRLSIKNRFELYKIIRAQTSIKYWISLNEIVSNNLLLKVAKNITIF